MPPSFPGVNHNIYSQSIWTSRDPGTLVWNPRIPDNGTNCYTSGHGVIDFFHGKAMRFLRLMFTWEWLQPALFDTIPGSGGYRTYWDAFVDTVE